MSNKYFHRRNTYINQVKKQLSDSPGLLKRVLRDLNEIFDSAEEHGESLETVIYRLGDPKEFCAGIRAGAEGEKSVESKTSQKSHRITIGLGVITAALIISAKIFKAFQHDDYIGGADAMTQIKVFPFMPFTISAGLFVAGLFFLVATVSFYILKQKKR
ncbi:MAG: hypothetical protein LKJ17_07365 [Oscillospiraceae bacterium]|jgi:uncharacterized membrane protein|nr:hypothetical protein [Oscillospiraceae bacterium]